MRKASSDGGFSLIEVIIAMFLLGLVAMALLPALWQGIAVSSQQSATATATRHLNAIVEKARDDPTCLSLTALVATPPAVDDGKGAALVVVADLDDSAGAQLTAADCTGPDARGDEVVELSLQLSRSDGTSLARTTALIYMP